MPLQATPTLHTLSSQKGPAPSHQPRPGHPSPVGLKRLLRPQRGSVPRYTRLCRVIFTRLRPVSPSSPGAPRRQRPSAVPELGGGCTQWALEKLRSLHVLQQDTHLPDKAIGFASGSASLNSTSPRSRLLLRNPRLPASSRSTRTEREEGASPVRASLSGTSYQTETKLKPDPGCMANWYPKRRDRERDGERKRKKGRKCVYRCM